MAIHRWATPKLRTKAVLRWDRFSGRHMLLYPERGLSLNAVASAIVERCDGKHTVDAIVAELCDCFSGAEPGEVERDVLEFLDELVARGLLEGIG
jgi:coenzyme PQQ biosynthesis protein PqqD